MNSSKTPRCDWKLSTSSDENFTLLNSLEMKSMASLEREREGELARKSFWWKSFCKNTSHFKISNSKFLLYFLSVLSVLSLCLFRLSVCFVCLSVCFVCLSVCFVRLSVCFVVLELMMLQFYFTLYNKFLFCVFQLLLSFCCINCIYYKLITLHNEQRTIQHIQS